MFKLEPLLDVKLRAPRVASPTVPRLRLIEQLCEGLDRKLTLIKAPPGFGKTTAASAWAEALHDRLDARPTRVVWVSLDEYDNNPVQFWRYALTAIDRCLPGRAARALEVLTRSAYPPLEDILTLLINAVIHENQRVVLMLDDYHHVTDPVTTRSLAFLLEHLPLSLHLALLTRAEPSFSLARLRANRHVNELGLEDLRCTPQETQALLECVSGQPIDPATAHELHLRTEGWPVGLQLLAISLQGRREVAEVLKDLRGSHHNVFTYLMDEVLRQQPGEVQHFLLHSALLECLSAPLCDAVLERHDSERMLNELERNQLFLLALDGQRAWFRYHTLFREALLSRLNQQPAVLHQALHDRASLWFAEHGDTFSAVAHALQAGRFERAVALLATVPAPQLMESSLMPKLLRWFEQIPTDLIFSHNALWCPYVNALIYSGQHHAVRTWLRTLEDRVKSLQQHSGLPMMTAEDRGLTLGFIAAYQAILAGLAGDEPRTRALADEASRLLPEEGFPNRTLAVYAHSLAALINGQLLLAHGLSTRAALMAEQNGQIGVGLLFNLTAALYRYMSGQPRDAWRFLEDLARPGMPPLNVASVGYSSVLRGLLLLERNELDAALEAVEQGIHLAEHRCYTSVAEFGLVVLAHVQVARGEYDSASLVIERISQIAGHRVSTFQHTLWLTPLQVRLWLLTGQLSTARIWADSQERAPHPTSVMVRERLDLTRARVLLALHQPERVLDLLEPVVTHAVQQGRGEHVLEARMLQAGAHHQRGALPDALDAVTLAVRQGEPQGYVRRFLNEGSGMAELLALLQRERARDVPAAYLTALLGAFQPTTPTPAPASPEMHVGAHHPLPLTAREMDVLALLARGLSNDDIARHLDLSLHTVKSHVHNLSSKLHSKNRTQTVAKARSLGYIPPEP
ncbi:LuxR C-terminal-related transcriptional regulator [Deinococcus apachensis]|uniref:LuxR C-terminal-related transcriptional regulator n=1 Tax=Deinococcus apachensis TaxID=309886 RepID=UPI00036F8C5D|nr:LuxR C-terminal-related transcriptional regulator [Deinococcus apachensis]